MNKRAFLGSLLSFAAFSLLWPAGKITALFNRLKTVPLSDHEITTAAIIAEYIYPEDTDPGALSLGMETYIANQCADPYFKRYQVPLQRIVAFVDAASRGKKRNDFKRLDAPARRAILDRIASGEADRSKPGIRQDFFALVDLTIEGCFCDPVHGGNRDALAWRLFDGFLKRDWFNA